MNKDTLLTVFIIILPFNLFIGRIVPEIVALPFFIADFVLLLLGTWLLIDWEQVYFENTQRIIVILFCLFFVASACSLFFHWNELMPALSSNDATYELFKKIMSNNVLHMFNKLFHLLLAFVLFITLLQSKKTKKELLQYACIPLLLVVISTIFLVILQQEVTLDSGKAGAFIKPYGLIETGRAYFPFVNATLLGLYLSTGFFIILYLLLTEKQKKVQYGYYIFAFLALLTLDFTKSRTALASVLILCVGLLFFFLIKKKEILLPKKILISIGLFLLLLNLHVFIFHSFSFLTTVNTFFDEQQEKVNVQTVNTVENPEALTNNVESDINKTTITEQLNQTQLQVANQYSEFHSRRTTYHWPTALALFKEQPIFGIGTGAFFYSVVDGEKDVLCQNTILCPDNQQATDISSTAHSIYLQILAENGIVGFILFIFLTGLIIYYGMMSKEIYLFFALLCFFIQGLFFSYFEYMEMVYLFWLLVGLLLKKE